MNATAIPTAPGFRLVEREWRRADGSTAAHPAIRVSLGHGKHRTVPLRGDRESALRQALEIRAAAERAQAARAAARAARTAAPDLGLVEAFPERGVWYRAVPSRRRDGSALVLHYYVVTVRRGQSSMVRIRAGEEIAALDAARALRRRALAFRFNRKGGRP